MKLSHLFAPFVLGFLLFCAGCSSANEQEGIIGTWDTTEFSNVYVFLEDGTGTLSTKADESVVISFAYELTGDTITIRYNKPGAEPLAAKVSMPDQDTLILESSQPRTTITMIRR
jgi:hypothetical protein